MIALESHPALRTLANEGSHGSHGNTPSGRQELNLQPLDPYSKYPLPALRSHYSVISEKRCPEIKGRLRYHLSAALPIELPAKLMADQDSNLKPAD